MARFQVLLLPHLLLILFLLPEPGLCFPLPAVPPLLSPVPFDCRRIHPAFCCSSRVRQNCGQLCLPSSAPSFCIGQQGPQPQQPSATSFGGSIDSVNVNVPSEFNGPLPILPPPILPPPIFPSQQNNGQRRFTTEGERQSSTTWVRPEQAQRPPQLPPQPPLGLILPPTDIESAKGTPWVDPTGEDEDSDMAPPPNQQTGTFIGSGPQTEVDAATEGPAPFPTLMPSDLLPSIDELAVEQTAGNSKSHSETGEEPGPAPEEPSLLSRTDGGAIDGTAGKQNAKRRGGGGHRRGSVLKPAHLMGELEELEEEREEGMEVRQVASAEKTLNREASSSEDAKWWAPIRLSLLNGQQEERESYFKPDQPRTTVTEKNGGAVSTEMPPRKFAAFPPPPNGQFWSFRVKPSASDPQRQHQSKQEGSNQREGNNKNSEESSRLDLPLPTNAGVGEKRKEEEGGLFGEKIDVFVDRIFNRELLGSIAAITNGARGNKKNGTSSLPTHTSSNTFAPSTSPNPPAPATAVEQCGVAPLFQPCLPLAQANLRLQACCRSRLLPAGCLSLCRYETSQAEVKMAFDKGQCGILNVTPFLECASQGNNNLECCRHRELAKRSGTQCEVFCAGEKLGLLGIQHLVCSTQIQSILECHHSGLH